MNLQELIKKHNLKEGDEVLCEEGDPLCYPSGSYTLSQSTYSETKKLVIVSKGTGEWEGTISEFTLPIKKPQNWNGEGVPNFGDKLRICKKEWSFVGINSLGSWVLETEDGELKGFHSKDVKVVLNEEEIAISACTLDLLNIACSLEYRQDWESLAEGLYKEGYRKESK